MKKLLALLLALMMVLSLAACGGGDDDKTPAGNNPQSSQQNTAISDDAAGALAGTKTMAWFMEYAAGGSYTMESQVEFDGTTTASLNVYDGDRIYTETEAGGITSISIIMDGAMYVLDSASKTCMKMGLEMASMQEMIADEASAYETAVTTGETDVKGGTYFYEEFSVEGESVKYCFDGDELKFMVMEMDGSSYIMEILRMEKGADASLFEIPSDYTVMDMNNLGGLDMSALEDLAAQYGG